MSLNSKLEEQRFANGYELVDGVKMHAEHGDQFQIPHTVLKKYLSVGQFVELRLDSPRFSMHDDTAEQCSCPTCKGKMSKPILGHQHPHSIVPLPDQDVPSRGWGEDFWVEITQRDEDTFSGRVDNRLHETRLHEIQFGDEVLFHSDHVLAVHGSHRIELVSQMTPQDVKTLAQWLGQQRS